MTDLDPIATRQLFEAMTGELSAIEAFVPEIDDMQVVDMDGAGVALDAFGGQLFKTTLVGAQTEAAEVFDQAKVHQSSVTAKAHLVTSGITKALLQYRRSEVVGELLAVRGMNVFLGQSEEHEHRYHGDFLNDTEILFGFVKGVAYGGYMMVKPHDVQKSIANRTAVTGEEREGGLLMLGDVKICDDVPGEFGQVDRTYAEVNLPIHDEMFQWYLAHHLNRE